MKSRVVPFLDRVEKTEDCWLWTGPQSNNGYGMHHPGGGQKWFAHRWSYTAYKGPIPQGLVIDHLCRVKLCVNPDHLEAVTQRQNVIRGECHTAINAMLTACRKGHPFNGANTYVDKRGSRHCRTCTRDRMRARRAAGLYPPSRGGNRPWAVTRT